MNRRDDATAKDRIMRNPSTDRRPAAEMPAGPIWRAPQGNAAAPSQATQNSESLNQTTSQSFVAQTIRPRPATRKRNQNQARSAIVRPKPQPAGDGTLRFDQPTTPEPNLLRVSRLENYVQWLNEQEEVAVENELTRHSQSLQRRQPEPSGTETCEPTERMEGQSCDGFETNELPAEAAGRLNLASFADRAGRDSTTPSKHDERVNRPGYRFTPITGSPAAMANFFAHGNRVTIAQAELASAKLAKSTSELESSQLEFAHRQIELVSQATVGQARGSASLDTTPLVVMPQSDQVAPSTRQFVDVDLASGTVTPVSPETEPTQDKSSRSTEEQASSQPAGGFKPSGLFRKSNETEAGEAEAASSLPVSIHRIDRSHAVGLDTSTPHVNFTEESQVRNRWTRSEAADDGDSASAEPQLGDASLPFSSVSYDEQTADVIATISAAIASVIQGESEQQLKQQAEALLQSASKEGIIPQATTEQAGARNEGAVDPLAAAGIEPVISEEMLDDIIRQRFDHASSGPAVSKSLQAKADAHQERVNQAHGIPLASVVSSSAVATAHPVTSVAAFASSQPLSSTEPAVQVGTHRTPADSGTGVASTAQDTNGRWLDVPMELAAWDVEDFRWPVVSNQMIVKGGEAIEGLLAATMATLPQQPRRVAVSGIGRAQGSTSIAITMARWAVAAGFRTLLVDADVASPSLSGRLGMASNMSWLNGINHELPIAELIIRSRITNFCLMPLASSVTRVTWPRFIFDNLGELLEPVSEAFDLILIDAGPASQLLDELSSPSRLVDAVMLVNDVNNAAKLDVFKTRLSAFGIEKFIVAENRVPQTSTNVA